LLLTTHIFKIIISAIISIHWSMFDGLYIFIYCHYSGLTIKLYTLTCLLIYLLTTQNKCVAFTVGLSNRWQNLPYFNFQIMKSIKWIAFSKAKANNRLSKVVDRSWVPSQCSLTKDRSHICTHELCDKFRHKGMNEWKGHLTSDNQSTNSINQSVCFLCGLSNRAT